MKTISKILLVCFIILSCNSDDDLSGCSVANPVEDLAWLKAEIEQREQNITEDSKYCYISQSSYNNQTIFIFGDCNLLIDKVILVYNCEGKNIGFVGDGDIPIESIENSIIIWKTNDFVCEL